MKPPPTYLERFDADTKASGRARRLILPILLIALMVLLWVCYDVACTPPTLSGIQHAAAPLIAFRGPFSMLVAILKRLKQDAK